MKSKFWTWENPMWSWLMAIALADLAIEILVFGAMGAIRQHSAVPIMVGFVFACLICCVVQMFVMAAIEMMKRKDK